MDPKRTVARQCSGRNWCRAGKHGGGNEQFILANWTTDRRRGWSSDTAKTKGLRWRRFDRRRPRRAGLGGHLLCRTAAQPPGDARGAGFCRSDRSAPTTPLTRSGGSGMSDDENHGQGNCKDSGNQAQIFFVRSVDWWNLAVRPLQTKKSLRSSPSCIFWVGPRTVGAPTPALYVLMRAERRHRSLRCLARTR